MVSFLTHPVADVQGLAVDLDLAAYSSPLAAIVDWDRALALLYVRA